MCDSPRSAMVKTGGPSFCEAFFVLLGDDGAAAVSADMMYVMDGKGYEGVGESRCVTGVERWMREDALRVDRKQARTDGRGGKQSQAASKIRSGRMMRWNPLSSQGKSERREEAITGKARKARARLMRRHIVAPFGFNAQHAEHSTEQQSRPWCSQ